MTELIIIKTNNSQPIKKLLEQAHIDYKVYQEPKNQLGKEQLKKRLIAAYQRQAKNKKLQSELALWDSISGEGLNGK